MSFQYFDTGWEPKDAQYIVLLDDKTSYCCSAMHKCRLAYAVFSSFLHIQASSTRSYDVKLANKVGTRPINTLTNALQFWHQSNHYCICDTNRDSTMKWRSFLVGIFTITLSVGWMDWSIQVLLRSLQTFLHLRDIYLSGLHRFSELKSDQNSILARSTFEKVAKWFK